MPIEIKELLIEINVISDEKSTASAGSGSNGQTELLANYTEQIMLAIDNKKER